MSSLIAEEEKVASTNDVPADDMQEVDPLGDDDNVDAGVYDHGNDLVEDNKESQFQCVNPQNVGGHIVYSCKGVDEDGSWEG